LNYQPVSEEILRKTLREQDVDIIAGNKFGKIRNDTPENLIVNELINFPEVDYDEQADFLFKLATQATSKFREYLNEDELENVVQYHKSEIGRFTYQQLMEHFYIEAPEFEKPVVDVKAFTKN
jgi:type III restriction enzyme